MRKILAFLAITVMLSIGTVLALEKTITLDTVADGCLGTDCEYMLGASGTLTIDDCRDKLYLNVGLNGLYVHTSGQSNYQITIQTYSGDKRLDSTEVCANPNAPMGGAHPNAWECGSWQDYSFYNFEMDALTTDGTFNKSYEISLPKGCYDVIFLVKHDKVPEGTGGASYPIILQKGHVTFCVVDYCTSQQEKRISKLEEEDQKIWNKLHHIQDEIVRLDDRIDQLRIYIDGKLLEIWEKLHSIQQEIQEIWDKIHIIKQNCNENDDEFCDGDYKVIQDYYCESGYGTDTNCLIQHCLVDETRTFCEYGCSGRECLEPPKEDCNLKDNTYCDGDDKVTEDYYCEASYGTDWDCVEGHCLMTETRVTCEYGCSNGECNPPPVTTTIPTTTIPPPTTRTCREQCQNLGYRNGYCMHDRCSYWTLEIPSTRCGGWLNTCCCYKY